MRIKIITPTVGLGLTTLFAGTDAKVWSSCETVARQYATKNAHQATDESTIQENAEQGAARLAKNARYNGGGCDLTVLAPDQGCFFEQSWPRALPVIPLRETDMAVLGRVTDMRPYLSADHTHIYTEITLNLEELFKTSRELELSSKQNVVIDIIGGTITMPSGQTASDNTKIDFLGRPRVGGRYILFAKKIHNEKDLTLVRGYEFREGRVFKLKDDGSPGEALVAVSTPGVKQTSYDEENFLQAVRSRALELKKSR